MKIIKNTLQYRQFQKKIHIRDNYTCCVCGEQTYPLKITNPPKELGVKWNSNESSTICLECYKKIS